MKFDLSNWNDITEKDIREGEEPRITFQELGNQVPGYVGVEMPVTQLSENAKQGFHIT